jgi:hypothetical protein
LAGDGRQHRCDCGFAWVGDCGSAKVGRDPVGTDCLDRCVDPSGIAP